MTLTSVLTYLKTILKKKGLCQDKLISYGAFSEKNPSLVLGRNSKS